MIIKKSFKQRVHAAPRISINPLCEYVLNASPLKRNKIIESCKRPPAFLTRYYNNAEDVLAFYLAKIKDDPKFLEKEVQRLRLASYSSDQLKREALTSADSIDGFLNHEIKIRAQFKDYTFRISSDDTKFFLTIRGVKVSFRPELLIIDSLGTVVGFLKFSFCKTEEVGRPKGELISSLGQYYFKEVEGLALNRKLCLTLDVFRGRTFTAPPSNKRNMRNLEHACEEIADRWDRF